MPSEVEELLTSKGPGKIPVWAYGVGLAGAFLAFEWYRNKNNAASTAGQNASQPPAPGTTTVTTTSRGGGGAPWPWRPFWTIGPGQPPSPGSNTEWRHMAADWLESKGEPTGRVNDVLADYLDGQQLDRDEQRLVDLAVDEWGRPPDGVKPGIRVGNFGGGSDSDVADTGAAGADTGVSGGAGRASADIRVKDTTVERREPERRRRRR